jgi:hypothetical protein
MKEWNSNMQKFKEIEYHYDKLKVLWPSYWKEEVVFTYQWWIMILILILPFFRFLCGESIFTWLRIYKVLKWEHIYSVPFYILIGIFVKVVLKKFISIETKSRNEI